MVRTGRKPPEVRPIKVVTPSGSLNGEVWETDARHGVDATPSPAPQPYPASISDFLAVVFSLDATNTIGEQGDAATVFGSEKNAKGNQEVAQVRLVPEGDRVLLGTSGKNFEFDLAEGEEMLDGWL